MNRQILLVTQGPQTLRNRKNTPHTSSGTGVPGQRKTPRVTRGIGK